MIKVEFAADAPRWRLCARHSRPRRRRAARPARRARRVRARARRARRRGAALRARAGRHRRDLRRRRRRGPPAAARRPRRAAERRRRLRAGRRRADRAAAGLGRDQAGRRSLRRSASPAATPPGSPSARRRAAGATTSTGPSCRASRSRRWRRSSWSAPATDAEQEWARLAALLAGLDLTRNLVTEPANIVYPETFVERVRAALDGTGVEIEVLDEKAMAQARHGRPARRRAGLGPAAAPARDALERRQGRRQAGRLRRQGHHLRHRRHLDQAGARHGGDEVGHGRRRRGRRR